MRHYLRTLVIGTLILCGLSANAAQAQVAHVFRYKPDAGSTVKTVTIGGDFNGWSTTATAMDKTDDGTFVATVKLTPGKHLYKFILDGSTWINDPSADKSLEEDDGQQGKNSAVIIATTDKPADDKPASGQIEHTFSYHPADGTSPKTVNVAGEFNKWSTDANPMKRGDDGTFTAKIKLAPGTYPYKFVMDGTQWVNDPAADKSLDQSDGNGGANSVVVIK